MKSLTLLLLVPALAACASVQTGSNQPPAADEPATGPAKTKAAFQLPEKVELVCPEDCESRAESRFRVRGWVEGDKYLRFLQMWTGGLTIETEVDLSSLKVLPPDQGGCPWDCLLQNLANQLGLEVELEELTVRLKTPE